MFDSFGRRPGACHRCVPGLARARSRRQHLFHRRRRPALLRILLHSPSGNRWTHDYCRKRITPARPHGTWADAEFNDTNAPLELDGVSVTVNNKPAFVNNISTTQININTPDDKTLGPVNIQVKNSLGSNNVSTTTR